jgi:polyribonucleotide nucleotidyltransferase
MDFKVAGTAEGITALQMDIKIRGLSGEVMAEALEQARQARLQVLEVMNATISGPAEMNPYAPRLTIIKIDPDKIGAIIGPGGKTVRKIQEETGVTIDIEEDGTVYIAATDGASAQRAQEMVEELVEEAEIGRIYTGRVTRVEPFGAFVEILPGVDGLIHISQLDVARVERVEDVVRVGDEVMAMVVHIDPVTNKIRLSRQAVLEGWTPDEVGTRYRHVGGGGGSRGGPRGGGRGGSRSGGGGSRGGGSRGGGRDRGSRGSGSRSGGSDRG